MTDNVKPKEFKNTEAAAPRNAETEDVQMEPAEGLNASGQTMTENNSALETNEIENDKPEPTSDLSSA